MTQNERLTLAEITSEWIRTIDGPPTDQHRYENHLEIKKQLSQLLKASSKSQLNTILNESWLCSFCNTLNGCLGNRKIIRKICFKCRRTKVNPISYLEELGIEFLKDYKADLIIGDIKELKL